METLYITREWQTFKHKKFVVNSSEFTVMNHVDHLHEGGEGRASRFQIF